MLPYGNIQISEKAYPVYWQELSALPSGNMLISSSAQSPLQAAQACVCKPFISKDLWPLPLIAAPDWQPRWMVFETAGLVS